MEHSLCRPLGFNQSATNMQSFPLNSSKFDVSAVSTMIYQPTEPTWNSISSTRNMKSRLAIKFLTPYEW